MFCFSWYFFWSIVLLLCCFLFLLVSCFSSSFAPEHLFPPLLSSFAFPFLFWDSQHTSRPPAREEQGFLCTACSMLRSDGHTQSCWIGLWARSLLRQEWAIDTTSWKSGHSIKKLLKHRFSKWVYLYAISQMILLSSS